MGRTLVRVVFPLMYLLGYMSLVGQASGYQMQVFNGYVPELNIGFLVSDVGSGKVDFVIYNQSSINSSIAQIYFDNEASLLSSAEVIGGAGTSFEQDASPANLPGGKSAFNFISQFSFGASAPPATDGINPAEQTSFRCSLSDGFGIGDVESALGNGTLRIGAHIIGLPGGSSVSAISTPLPATGILFGLGTFFIRTFGRKTGEGVHPVKQIRNLV